MFSRVMYAASKDLQEVYTLSRLIDKGVYVQHACRQEVYSEQADRQGESKLIDKRSRLSRLGGLR